MQIFLPGRLAAAQMPLGPVLQQNGITNSVDTTHFGPDWDCTRGQIVTFFYRAIK